MLLGISRFHNRFQNNHVVLPVIHVETEAQALRNAGIAFSANADGIFLINHTIRATVLLDIFSAVAAEFPSGWIGLNCLDLSPREVFRCIPARVDGVWVDNAMIDERSGDQSPAEQIIRVQKETGFSGLYFGGVAFKYQRHVEDLGPAARKAAALMDVVTTSGAGTGVAAFVEKIRVMKEALGSFPLALASGVTPENVTEYLPYSDCYLVATGISKSFTELDPPKVRQLVRGVR
jgi:hypothetical protein